MMVAAQCWNAQTRAGDAMRIAIPTNLTELKRHLSDPLFNEYPEMVR